MSVYDLKQFQVSRAESPDQYNALFAHALYSSKIERPLELMVVGNYSNLYSASLLDINTSKT
ncbi:hypothetical protein ALQ08_103546 [Pseudomonas syringae pv. delphinii]|uniref:Uncharacterized protein n=1 Tax=Pseudomonas syringae pv. delphinii TaxID=192088 RepID=A0A0N8REW9_9PSED|nr:hypothetical protein ALO72_102853 [Pseudomonas syringae pv. delphinii]RMP10453.1 hypothetical protein ALQ28_103366 [Pseudomonas syringae pv. delphinii]RMP25315.1 hypothetical protein ALQ27_103613 [Pseudomonas syringae pv. delphinii]RMQ16405.1 hypothetical protein ALQ08_103546 [Pseudomonas syringae pv. delphinii]